MDKFKLNYLVFSIISMMCFGTVLLDDSHVGGLMNVFGYGDFFSDFGIVSPSKYDFMHKHKYATNGLTEKCIKFHDSEIVLLDIHRTVGRWDTHMLSLTLPVDYKYAVSEIRGNLLHFNYLPVNFESTKTTRNDSNIIKGAFVVNSMLGVTVPDDEAMIAIEYDSYFLKVSCFEALGGVSGTLHFQLRPKMTAQLASNPKLFHQIIESIPIKSLIKIQKLIENLKHYSDKRFENFGKDYAKTLEERLEKFRSDNELSDKTDEQVFDYLSLGCRQFTKDELKVTDISTIKTTKWSLDYANYNYEKIAFNRMSFNRRSENSFAVTFSQNYKHLADSDHYYDHKQQVFWAYIEGRRSREVHLFSDNDYRITYSCDERQVNGRPHIREILRFFSSETLTKPNDWSLYLNLLVTHLKPNTLEKLSDLRKYMSPVVNGMLDKSERPGAALDDQWKHTEL